VYSNGTRTSLPSRIEKCDVNQGGGQSRSGPLSRSGSHSVVSEPSTFVTSQMQANFQKSIPVQSSTIPNITVSTNTLPTLASFRLPPAPPSDDDDVVVLKTVPISRSTVPNSIPAQTKSADPTDLESNSQSEFDRDKAGFANQHPGISKLPVAKSHSESDDSDLYLASVAVESQNLDCAKDILDESDCFLKLESLLKLEPFFPVSLTTKAQAPNSTIYSKDAMELIYKAYHVLNCFHVCCKEDKDSFLVKWPKFVINTFGTQACNGRGRNVDGSVKCGVA
jgi:hypothetical protein